MTELEKKSVESHVEIARAYEALKKAKVEHAALQTKVDQLTQDLTKTKGNLDAERNSRAEQNTHVLVRLDSYLHH